MGDGNINKQDVVGAQVPAVLADAGTDHQNGQLERSGAQSPDWLEQFWDRCFSGAEWEFTGFEKPEPPANSIGHVIAARAAPRTRPRCLKRQKWRTGSTVAYVRIREEERDSTE